MSEQDGFPGLPIPTDPVPADTSSNGHPAPADTGTTGADTVHDQPVIWDAEPEPRQLALIPDPDPWEADRPSPASARPTDRGGRLARRRHRNANPSPGQLSLF